MSGSAKLRIDNLAVDDKLTLGNVSLSANDVAEYLKSAPLLLNQQAAMQAKITRLETQLKSRPNHTESINSLQDAIKSLKDHVTHEEHHNDAQEATISQMQARLVELAAKDTTFASEFLDVSTQLSVLKSHTHDFSHVHDEINQANTTAMLAAMQTQIDTLLATQQKHLGSSGHSTINPQTMATIKSLQASVQALRETQLAAAEARTAIRQDVTASAQQLSEQAANLDRIAREAARQAIAQHDASKLEEAKKTAEAAQRMQIEAELMNAVSLNTEAALSAAISKASGAKLSEQNSALANARAALKSIRDAAAVAAAEEQRLRLERERIAADQAAAAAAARARAEAEAQAAAARARAEAERSRCLPPAVDGAPRCHGEAGSHTSFHCDHALLSQCLDGCGRQMRLLAAVTKTATASQPPRVNRPSL